jgi:hypothetical protein
VRRYVSELLSGPAAPDVTVLVAEPSYQDQWQA